MVLADFFDLEADLDPPLRSDVDVEGDLSCDGGLRLELRWRSFLDGGGGGSASPSAPMSTVSASEENERDWSRLRPESSRLEQETEDRIPLEEEPGVEKEAHYGPE